MASHDHYYNILLNQYCSLSCTLNNYNYGDFTTKITTKQITWKHVLGLVSHQLFCCSPTHGVLPVCVCECGGVVSLYVVCAWCGVCVVCMYCVCVRMHAMTLTSTNLPASFYCSTREYFMKGTNDTVCMCTLCCLAQKLVQQHIHNNSRV